MNEEINISKCLTDELKRNLETINKLEKVISNQTQDIRVLNRAFDIGFIFRDRILLMCHDGFFLPSTSKEYRELINNFDNLAQTIRRGK